MVQSSKESSNPEIQSKVGTRKVLHYLYSVHKLATALHRFPLARDKGSKALSKKEAAVSLADRPTQGAV